LHHRLEPPVFSPELRELVCIAGTSRIDERSLDFLSAGEGGR
jgi:hypothetical protein